MDNFTLAVVIGDVAMLVTFVVLVLMDMKGKNAPAEPAKVAGKRPA